ncbi:MAG: HAD-IC family P-type ATPase, partial [Desulfuromonadales bacterium]|nr:HAD-IC family P-type ATPase [Desulfuromonadales bacterium]
MANTQNSDLPPWHTLPAEEVLHTLQSDRGGLTEEQVRQRLVEYGPNRLRQEKGPGPLARFLAQFNNILIYILLAAAVVSGVLGEWIDMWVIVAVVLIIAVIGFFQEGKAEQALESIRRMLSLEAKVRRDGGEWTIDAEELVPGDIVLLKTGGKVPADLRLLEVRDVLVEEAMLTGESEPVPKSPEPVEAEAAIGDRQCMAYSGTLLTSGTLVGVVVATGDRSEIGRIGRLVAEVEELTTPLLRKMDRFGRWLSGAILALGVVVFLLGVFVRGYPPGQMLMIVVSLAVAAIPEGLPAVMTITLALGVQTMARRHAIIRRLPAVETLGSVTVICSDKTGTLTRNEMTVKRIATTGELLAVTGTGYQPQGELRRDDQPVSLADLPQAAELVRTALLCSDARLLQDEASGEWRIDGQPTEGAMVVLGRKAGLTRGEEEKKSPRLDTIPFKSENRFMA